MQARQPFSALDLAAELAHARGHTLQHHAVHAAALLESRLELGDCGAQLLDSFHQGQGGSFKIRGSV
jgi:hypothetical protein